MTEVPVWIASITVAEYRDGFWDEGFGTVKHHLYFPLENFDGMTEAGFRKVVECHPEPVAVVIAPAGWEMSHKGRVTRLKAPDGRLYDANCALIMARRGEGGLKLKGPVEVLRPLPGMVSHSGNSKQGSMFD